MKESIAKCLWFTAAFFVAGCSPTASTTDGGFHLADGEFELVIVGPKLQDFETRIDGEVRTEVTYILDQAQELAMPSKFVVEVYFKPTNTLIDRSITSPQCPRNPEFPEGLVSEELRVYGHANGHLVRSGSNCSDAAGAGGNTEQVEQDCQSGWQLTDCNQDRCGLRLVHRDPDIVHLACTAEGSLPAGSECAFGAVSPDNFDDCEQGTGCVDGLCRGLCYPSLVGSCDSWPETECVALVDLGHTWVGFCQ